MHAIAQCVGPNEFGVAAQVGWAKIYSQLLDVIIPEVVKFELQNREQADQIRSKRSNSAQSLSTSVHSSMNELSVDNLSLPRLPEPTNN
jgi:hypothetical protein